MCDVIILQIGLDYMAAWCKKEKVWRASLGNCGTVAVEHSLFLDHESKKKNTKKSYSSAAMNASQLRRENATTILIY